MLRWVAVGAAAGGAMLAGCGGPTTPATLDDTLDGGTVVPPQVVGLISAEFAQSGGEERLSASALFIEVDPRGDNGDATRIGSCTVMQGRIDVPDEGTGFAGGRVLDAGMAGVVSNGTTSVEMSRIAPGNYEAFEDLIGSGFAPLQTLSYRFDGGADIASFDATIMLPGAPQVTAPDLNDTDLRVETNRPLRVTWVPAASSSAINVTLTATGATELVTVDCVGDDTGALTVPAEALERLPVDRVAVTLSIARTNVATVMVELTPAGVGVVQMTGLNLVSRVIPEQ